MVRPKEKKKDKQYLNILFLTKIYAPRPPSMMSKNPGFKTIKMPYRMVGPFIFYKELRNFINQYDVIIISTHLKLLNLILLPFFPHKPKIVSWSIGRYITYNRKYDLESKPTFKDKLLRLIHEHSDACIVYTSQVIDYWKRYQGRDYDLKNKNFITE